MNPDSWSRAYELSGFLLETLLRGALVTVQIASGSFCLALALGLLFATLQRSKSRPLRILVRVYVEVFRGVPVLAILFVIYFGLAQIGIRLNPLPAAVLGFGIYGGAYVTEIFRAAIESVHRGQLEAGYMIGLTRLQVLRFIVLPQAVKVVLPPLANFAVGLLKDTALASAVAAPELTFNARVLINQTYLSSQIYLGVAVLYLAMSLPLSYLTRLLEARSKQGAG